MLSRCFQLIAVGGLVTSPVPTAQANLIVNGDFSLGNTGFASGYAYITNAIDVGQYTVGANPQLFNPGGASYGDHTTGSGLMMILDGAVVPDVTVWQQAVSVDTGTDYTFSGWAASWGNNGGFDPSPAVLGLFVNGVRIGNDFTLAAASGQWNQFLANWNSGTSTTAVLRIVDINSIPSGAGNDFTLDDLSFGVAAVPEPSSLILLTLGSLGYIAHSRRCRNLT